MTDADLKTLEAFFRERNAPVYHEVSPQADGTALALLGAKLLAVCITLASGGSGGVFAPSLFLGAMLGGLVGFAARSNTSVPELVPHG